MSGSHISHDLAPCLVLGQVNTCDWRAVMEKKKNRAWPPAAIEDSYRARWACSGDTAQIKVVSWEILDISRVSSGNQKQDLVKSGWLHLRDCVSKNTEVPSSGSMDKSEGS